MGWLKGKSTGNHRFSHRISDFPVICPLNQSIEKLTIFKGLKWLKHYWTMQSSMSTCICQSLGSIICWWSVRPGLWQYVAQMHLDLCPSESTFFFAAENWKLESKWCGYSNKPSIFDSLYHPFMVIREMVYCCCTNIRSKHCLDWKIGIKKMMILKGGWLMLDGSLFLKRWLSIALHRLL